MNKIVVFANDAGSAAELTSGAKFFGASVTLITSGTEFGCADKVYTYGRDISVAAALNDIVNKILGENPDILFCETGRNGKLVAGYAAAKLKVSPLCDVMSIECSGGKLVSTRLVYGGGAVKTEESTFPAVAVVPAGIFEATARTAQASEAMQINGSGALKLISVTESEASSVNLAAAKRVIGAGRGLGSADNIPAFEKLASILNAEVGCTRPAAEEEHWYPKERYIGVSGCMLKPSFYMAVGISGQIQHMVGVNQSTVLFAIDKNENAPIVSQADYILIGDINTILPALIEKLR